MSMTVAWKLSPSVEVRAVVRPWVVTTRLLAASVYTEDLKRISSAIVNNVRVFMDGFYSGVF